MGFLRRNLRMVGDYFLGLNAIDHYKGMRRFDLEWADPRSLIQYRSGILRNLVVDLALKASTNVATGLGVYALANSESSKALLVVGCSELIRIGSIGFMNRVRKRELEGKREELANSSLNQQRRFLEEFEREVPRIENEQPKSDEDR